ncbi:MAG: hypothetical protein AAFN51_11885 [Pseudomonadota bacterium]
MLRNMIVLTLLVGLAACGTDRVDRAVTGGAIGAAAGALGAAAYDRDLASGLIVGGAIGAAAGGLTDADDINLGDPIYRRR